MMRLHFIAIGGSAMHSLALGMLELGHRVTGSDDVIFEPSKSKLQNAGILPETEGWFPEKISEDLDIVVLGMHAKKNNTELVRAQELNLNIQSYPEFLALLTENKTRVAVAGSHGKTTITAMVLHALKYHDIDTDYMVGAPVSEDSKTLSITDENDFVLLEGDEYLSSAIDPQPKFLWYTPEIALISGIAWDHVNVFPTFENYCSQFELFINSIQAGGVLIYNEEDEVLKKLVESNTHPIKKIGYRTPEYFIDNGITFLETEEGSLPLAVFGIHNLQNLVAAQWIAQLMGLDSSDFFEAIPSFKGAAKRLELLARGAKSFLFKDFAHAPSKVKASSKAVSDQFKGKNIIVCLELHTYSSLDPEFIKQYAHSLESADEAIIFYDPEALKIKNRVPIPPEDIEHSFAHQNLRVVTDAIELKDMLLAKSYTEAVLVMMSSGNFGGMDWSALQQRFL